MAQKLIVERFQMAQNAGLTRFASIYDGASAVNNATESTRAVPQRALGTYDYLTTKCITFTLGGGATKAAVTSRVNSGAGAQAVNVTGTGTFQDTSNSDAPTAGQTYGVQIVNDAGTGSAIIVSHSMRFAGSSFPNTMIYGAGRAGVYTANSQTSFNGIGGQSESDLTVEASVQSQFKAPATLGNMSINFNSNTRATSSVILSRVGGANGNCTVTFTAAQTGLMEDTSNSDALSSGSLVCSAVSTSTGGGSMTSNFFAFSCAFPGPGAMVLGCGNGAGSVAVNPAANVTNYAPPAGVGTDTTSTESDAAILMTLATSQIVSNMSVYQLAANGAGTTTMTSRLNSAAGGSSITLAGTGYLEDTSGFDRVANGATLDIQYASNGSVSSPGSTTIRSFFMSYPDSATNFFFGTML